MASRVERDKESGLWDTIKTVGYAVLIALVVRTFAYEPFSIPSGSMLPTLLIGDYLFVSKFSYGYSQHSLPFSLPVISDRVFSETPERGDVVVFKLPTDNKTDFIKRIVGLPGDTIQLKRGILHINGKAVERRRVEDFVEERFPGRITRQTRYVETLPNGRQHFILELTDDSVFDNTQVYTVPPGHYFAMGDNRDQSRDSRFLTEVGFIPHKNLVGRADVLFFSIKDAAWRFWEWPETVRAERIFQGIE